MANQPVSATSKRVRFTTLFVKACMETKAEFVKNMIDIDKKH